jgi:hypothetical protein
MALQGRRYTPRYTPIPKYRFSNNTPNNVNDRAKIIVRAFYIFMGLGFVGIVVASVFTIIDLTKKTRPNEETSTNQ